MFKLAVGLVKQYLNWFSTCHCTKFERDDIYWYVIDR